MYSNAPFIVYADTDTDTDIAANDVMWCDLKGGRKGGREGGGRVLIGGIIS